MLLTFSEVDHKEQMS